VRRRALVIAGLVLALVAAVTISLPHESGTQRVVSSVGGFSVEIPRAWTAIKSRPTNETRTYYMHGRNNAALGLDHTAGFFVARYARSRDATLDTLASDIAKALPSYAEFARTTLHGRGAIVATYLDPDPARVDRLLRRQQRWRIVAFFVDSFVFQIGTWNTTGAPDQDIAESFVYRAPRPWRVRIEDAAFTLPGGWIQAKPNVDAAFHAWSPGDPADAWVYLFHNRDLSVRDQIALARRNIARGGGTDIVETARRLDFRFPDEGHPEPAHDTEWFAPDGHGGTFVLAVGYRAGDPTIGAQIKRTWRT
jgi:hypothetical protein